jgi:hypothetical protein
VLHPATVGARARIDRLGAEEQRIRQHVVAAAVLLASVVMPSGTRHANSPTDPGFGTEHQRLVDDCAVRRRIEALGAARREMRAAAGVVRDAQ